jgi:predicted DNA-binding transcriptional regulator AlpA
MTIRRIGNNTGFFPAFSVQLVSISQSNYVKNLNAKIATALHLLRMKVSKIVNEACSHSKWLSVGEVCEYLNISKSTFYKWRQTGQAPESRRLPNGDLRVREDWLIDFLLALPEGDHR